MKLDSNVKQEQIVEAAVRRFSHFGIAKTTLTEVADDLAVSKQALSYYFPDKRSLVKAVSEKLILEYGRRLKQEMDGAPSVELALMKLTEVKGAFFEKYFMLATQAEQMEIMNSQPHNKWKQVLTEQELPLLVALLENGVEKGELKSLDAPQTGELLLETLYAFARCVKDKGALPNAEAFREVQAKQQEVIRFFYQGFKIETWQN
jgi:TetR/AcrR family transcriptional repressor of mexJK operon